VHLFHLYSFLLPPQATPPIKMATSTTPCPTVPTFHYSSLASGVICPFYQQNPTASTSNSTPVQQPIVIASTQAQYTPIPPNTVAALRQTIGTDNALKSKSLGVTQPLPPALDVTKFHVRVTHAKYSNTPPVTTWTVFK
jgi:hypothetical protein